MKVVNDSEKQLNRDRFELFISFNLDGKVVQFNVTSYLILFLSTRNLLLIIAKNEMLQSLIIRFAEWFCNISL